jgi:hypothetical protein
MQQAERAAKTSKSGFGFISILAPGQAAFSIGKHARFYRLKGQTSKWETWAPLQRVAGRAHDPESRSIA